MNHRLTQKEIRQKLIDDEGYVLCIFQHKSDYLLHILCLIGPLFLPFFIIIFKIFKLAYKNIVKFTKFKTIFKYFFKSFFIVF